MKTTLFNRLTAGLLAAVLCLSGWLCRQAPEGADPLQHHLL